MFDFQSASESTLHLMKVFNVGIRDTDSRSALLPVPRIGLNTGQPAIFSAPGEYYSKVVGDKKIVTGYAAPEIRIEATAYKIVFETPNASKKHYYQSILIHEFVHFWEIRKIDIKTNKEDYIFEKEDLDLYMLQSYEFDAYLIQSAWYFSIEDSKLWTRQTL